MSLSSGRVPLIEGFFRKRCFIVELTNGESTSDILNNISGKSASFGKINTSDQHISQLVIIGGFFLPPIYSPPSLRNAHSGGSRAFLFIGNIHITDFL